MSHFCLQISPDLVGGKVDRNDVARGTNEIGGGYLPDTKGCSNGRIKKTQAARQVEDVIGPYQAIAIDGIQPSVFILLYPHAHDRKSGSIGETRLPKLLVKSYQLGIGAPAGAAPASPKVEHDIAAAHFFQGKRLPVKPDCLQRR